jgi:hypothetical protein
MASCGRKRHFCFWPEYLGKPPLEDWASSAATGPADILRGETAEAPSDLFGEAVDNYGKNGDRTPLTSIRYHRLARGHADHVAAPGRVGEAARWPIPLAAKATQRCKSCRSVERRFHSHCLLACYAVGGAQRPALPPWQGHAADEDESGRLALGFREQIAARCGRGRRRCATRAAGPCDARQGRGGDRRQPSAPHACTTSATSNCGMIYRMAPGITSTEHNALTAPGAPILAEVSSQPCLEHATRSPLQTQA